MDTGIFKKMSLHGKILSFTGFLFILVLFYNHAGNFSHSADHPEKSEPCGNSEAKPLIDVDEMLFSIKSFSIYAFDEETGE